MSLNSYLEFREAVDNGTAELMQKLEDDRFELAINREVSIRVNMIKEREKLKKEYPNDFFAQRMMSVYPSIHVFNPLEFSRLIYHKDTAKYLGVDIEELIKQKVDEKLK